MEMVVAIANAAVQEQHMRSSSSRFESRFESRYNTDPHRESCMQQEHCTADTGAQKP